MTSPVALPPVHSDLDLTARFAAQRQAFAGNPTPPAAQRRQWLKSLREALLAEQAQLIEAIDHDFDGRSADETLLAELLPSIQGLRHAETHVQRWMRPSRRRVGLAFQPASAQVRYQPLGVVGIIVPWNYPLFLAIGPLTCALAAGNRVMLKLSEATPASAQALKQLLARVFPEDLVSVVLGEVEVGQAFARLPFDHLLFTGATSVGRQVMLAAAHNLTPVTLELGGKSPAIVSASVPLQAFSDAYQLAVRRLYPHIADNPDYTAILHPRQLQRLQHLLDDARDQGAEVLDLYPGEPRQGRRLPPHLLLGVTDGMQVMQDEIFGPLLPLVPYDTLDQALAYINQRPRPLALYYFGYERTEQEHVLRHTHSGGVCLNDTLLHVAQDDLPFGGIGPSGMGHYHGHDGFLTFSKAKAVLAKQRLNAARLIYPPYGKALQRLVYKLFIR